MNVGTDVDERLGRVADGLSELLELEDTFVNVGGIIHGNIFVDRLGAPNLRRNLDDKCTGWNGDRRRRYSVERWSGSRRGSLRKEKRQSVEYGQVATDVVEDEIIGIEVVERFGVEEGRERSLVGVRMRFAEIERGSNNRGRRRRTGNRHNEWNSREGEGGRKSNRGG